jgi:hypothetical protein
MSKSMLLVTPDTGLRLDGRTPVELDLIERDFAIFVLIHEASARAVTPLCSYLRLHQ